MWRPVLAAVVLIVTTQSQYDVVIHGGRVMDPETGLDAVRDVGVRGGTIERVSADALRGVRTIDATDLVLAPGFIDLHSHGQDAENYRLKALDGVTTALELEIGVVDVAAFVKERAGRALVNFGTTVSHPGARVAVLGKPMPPGAIVPASGPETNNPISDEQFAQLASRLQHGLQ